MSRSARGESAALPAARALREQLRAKGQFWTPPWVAQAMVTYVLRAGAPLLFDPAVGSGAFLRAAQAVAAGLGHGITFSGCEMDPAALLQATREGLSASDLAGVEIRDFVLNPPEGPFPAIVANPPYIRHHRLPQQTKAHVRSLGMRLLGRPLDGRAGLHVYFLLLGLQLLAPGGRLAYLLPADVCEGVFASLLWRWVTGHYRLDAIVTFAAEASPFPELDINPILVMAARAEPRTTFRWARCSAPGAASLRAWVESGFQLPSGEGIECCERSVSEALEVGLSRAPRQPLAAGPTLGDFARVLRGIATGANAFFHLTRAQVATLGIPPDFLVPAIGRTRDVVGDVLTAEHLSLLDERGRPTLLFAPDGRPRSAFPPAVERYIQHGEGIGLPQRPLLSSREPWYRMERRSPPPILFAYLGRRNARFVRNHAGAVPLTGFLCVYPLSEDPAYVDALWETLRDPQTVANLPLVGKSYGGGAIKVEPRALERLPLPPSVLSAAGLQVPPRWRQLKLYASSPQL